MLLYFYGHSQLGIAFAVNQCERYTFFPKSIHDKDLKKIGLYPSNTRLKGIFLRSSRKLNIDFYSDADFSDLWGYENSQDPNCISSRPGCAVTLSYCPVLWTRTLQIKTALSTMEDEYSPLSMSIKELLHIIR